MCGAMVAVFAEKIKGINNLNLSWWLQSMIATAKKLKINLK